MTGLVIGLIILAIVIFLLVLPVHMEMSVTIHGRVDYRLRILFFFKLFGWNLTNNPDKKRESETGERKRSKVPSISRIYQAIQVSGLWKRTWFLIKRIAAGIKIRNIESDLKVSLGEDYYTGMFIGLLLPLTMFLNEWFSCDLKVLPVFEEDLMLEGCLSGRLWMRPVSILGSLVAFMLSRPMWQAVRILIKGK